MFRYWLLLVIFLCGCATLDTHTNAQYIAKTAGLQPFSIAANGFVLRAYFRLDNPNLPVNVYIEGDGLAWKSRYELSADPTPKTAIGLALAAADNAPNVLYLARPCQFNDFNKMPCDRAYWSGKRFSEKVIDAMNQALETFISKTHGQKINLIGYSGGAAVAALLVARRHDINSLRTVAGNLDHAYVNEYHHVDAMPASLNAIDYAEKMGGVPQLHFVGMRDNVIPKEVAVRFITRFPSHANAMNCAALIEVEANHQDNWILLWPQLLQHAMPCLAKK